MAPKHSAVSAEVGRRIAQHRARTGVSARALAECADMDLTNFQRIERGEGNPTISTLLQIATALEIDVGELVTGLDPADLQNGRYPYGYTEISTRRRNRGIY
ncbi:helix-turn-helix domain-containing protein [Microbacterium karelineae]|uniref:helix-turn-helix domain-containing protein n=1 Tax=Microbacterium karelineae TaxID=2654283 RepID=UPI0012EA95BD|nr:helix-turn-helix transcriptional regulator [Microbacterium karelineae]